MVHKLYSFPPSQQSVSLLFGSEEVESAAFHGGMGLSYQISIAPQASPIELFTVDFQISNQILGLDILPCSDF